MKSRNKILVLGDSTFSYTEGDPAHRFPVFFKTHLERDLPDVDWECDSEILYTTLTMATRVTAAMQRHQPDTVVLKISAMNFSREDIVNVVRDRWPALYRPTKTGAAWLRSAAGGGPRGAQGPRGWIYRGPHGLLSKVIGAEPGVSVEEAVEAVRQSIKEVLRKEGRHLLVAIPSPRGKTEVEAARRLQFRNDVSAFCDERRVAYYDPSKAKMQSGHQRNIGADGWHDDPSGRDYAALIMARALVASLHKPGQGGLMRISHEPLGSANSPATA